MNNMWGNAKYGGCYIHQNPYVTTKVGGKTCEAGDLLVLCRKTIENNVRINAALFQLKRAKSIFRQVVPDNPTQFELYATWPVFSLGRKFNSGMERDVEPKAVTPGAQYMFVNDFNVMYEDSDDINYCIDYPPVFTHSIPEPVMENRSDLSFGRFLWEFIHWQTGRPIAPQQDLAKDGWSKFIWDLIVKTHNAKISNINVGIQKKHNISRQQGDFFHFLTTDDCITHLPNSYFDMHENGEDKEPPQESIINEEEDGSISILFIDL